MPDAPSERRKFKRLNAPVYCRPLGRAVNAATEAPRVPVRDISLGGICVYTDDRRQLGERLELELWLPTGETLTLDTTVVWVDSLDAASPARFEVGLQFTDVAASDL